MGSRIFFSVIAGFVVGVGFRSFLDIGIPAIAFATSAGAIVLTVSALLRSRMGYALLAAVACTAFGAGVLRMDAAILAYDPSLVARIDERVTLIGIVDD